MKLHDVEKPETFWDVNMIDPENLKSLHEQTGYADHPQRILFRKWLQGRGYKTMLDCGAGPGWELDGLFQDKIDIKYTGLEITNLFLDKLKERGVDIIKAGVEEIPCEDNSFDLVYCRQTLEHVENFQKAIREMIRVARHSVYIAMNKDFGNRTKVRKQYGLWHNIYSMETFNDAINVKGVRHLWPMGLKSYIIFLGLEAE